MNTFDLIGGPYDGNRTALPPGHASMRVVILDLTTTGEIRRNGGDYLPGTRLGERGKLFWHPDPLDDGNGT